MMSDQAISMIISWWPWIYIKIIILVIAVLYIIFASISFRQIDLMNQMVEARISPVLRLIGLIHLGMAILIFFLALFLL
ncbi:MAG: DUF5657 family protein [Candidatus Gottesmanbacteria bacterium]